MDAHHLPASELHRVADLWYDDGNIVIQAGDAQYRVYRGTLARRSSVFRDLFSVPQPEDETLVDGCPFVRLPDAEEEVTPFLKALFDTEFFHSYPTPTTFSAIYGCLRLSHKYEVPNLTQRALVHLSSPFHTSLQQVESLRLCDGVSSSAWEEDHYFSRPANWAWKEPAAALICIAQLARQVGALWVLPTVFYHLTVADVGRDLYLGVQHAGITASLSSADQDAIHAAGPALSSATLAIMAILTVKGATPGCTTPLECLARRLDLVAMRQAHFSQHIRDPLHVWVPNNFTFLGGWLACNVCADFLAPHVRAVKDELWEDLPGLYGLPSWDDLRALKSASIGEAFADVLDDD
ncbi:BTB domain-containing protein [Mycena kentingensis (nom. inval.)]|nr:BTB domain-containing protein [Mycena kentingensis (nom. inval.)]